MRKSVLWVAVVLFSAIWGTMLIADEMCVPLGEITLKPLVDEAQRAEVDFPHAAHFGYSCQTCHHKWDNASSITGCTTSGCHDLDAVPRTDTGKPVDDPTLRARYYKDAYHGMCIGCHKEIKKENKAKEASKTALGQALAPAGPTGCIQCHPI